MAKKEMDKLLRKVQTPVSGPVAPCAFQPFKKKPSPGGRGPNLEQRAKADGLQKRTSRTLQRFCEKNLEASSGERVSRMMRDLKLGEDVESKVRSSRKSGVRTVKRKVYGPFDCTKVVRDKEAEPKKFFVANGKREELFSNSTGLDIAAKNSGKNIASLMQHFNFISSAPPQNSSTESETTYDFDYRNKTAISSKVLHDKEKAKPLTTKRETTYHDSYSSTATKVLQTELDEKQAKAKPSTKRETTYGNAYSSRKEIDAVPGIDEEDSCPQDTACGRRSESVLARNETTYRTAYGPIGGIPRTLAPTCNKRGTCNRNLRQTFSFAGSEDRLKFDTSYRKDFQARDELDAYERTTVLHQPKKSLDGILSGFEEW